MDVITGNWCRRHWAVPAMSKPGQTGLGPTESTQGETMAGLIGRRLGMTQVYGGSGEAEAAALLRDFFAAKR